MTKNAELFCDAARLWSRAWQFCGACPSTSAAEEVARAAMAVLGHEPPPQAASSATARSQWLDTQSTALECAKLAVLGEGRQPVSSQLRQELAERLLQVLGCLCSLPSGSEETMQREMLAQHAAQALGQLTDTLAEFTLVAHVLAVVPRVLRTVQSEQTVHNALRVLVCVLEHRPRLAHQVGAQMALLASSLRSRFAAVPRVVALLNTLAALALPQAQASPAPTRAATTAAARARAPSMPLFQPLMPPPKRRRTTAADHK